MFKIGSVENSIKMAILLQGRGKMKAYELAQELDVSERQILKYKKYLEEAGILIDSKQGAHGGYSMLGRSLLGLKIDEKDYMDYFTVNPKSNLDYGKYKKLCSDIHFSYISKRKMNITYRSLTSGYSNRNIHPYGLFNYKGDFYMVAYCENKERFLDFKICRIDSYEVLESKYNIDKNFSWDKYSKNCVGIYKDGDYDIVLKIKNPFSIIIKEKIWVDNQEIIEKEDKSIIFKASMKGYSEIKSWILSMGANVEVISPQNLREDIIDEIEKIKKLY